MISFEKLKQFFQQDLEQRSCIEICFSIKGKPRYDCCWMGKMPNPDEKTKDLHWYGLVPDGSEAYDYDNLEDFITAPVFDGSTLQELWGDITLESVDGCEAESYLQQWFRE